MSAQTPIQNGSFIREIPHIEQTESWDCGVTCILMILPTDLAEDLRQNLTTICAEEFANQSTWTIDLCYVLNHFSVKQKYHTKTLGINPSFSGERFYSNFISKDEVRVNARFQSAATSGILIESSRLELETILYHLEQNGPAIVLMDANLLDCQSCNSISSNIGQFLKKLLNTKLPFNGHYILVCGFDLDNKLIYYKDPAVKSELCSLTFTGFEKARKAHGTDDDVILIYLDR